MVVSGATYDNNGDSGVCSSSTGSSASDVVARHDDDNILVGDCQVDVTEIVTKEGIAYVIDSSINEDILEEIDRIRLSLPLNSKRPTVDRRFYVDHNKNKETTAAASFAADDDDTSTDSLSICKLLELTIQSAIRNTQNHRLQRCKDGDNEENSNNHDAAAGVGTTRCSTGTPGDDTVERAGVFVIKYLRFLEYTQIGTQKLDIHTDGCKVCEDTGYKSTHTLLLYLTTCEAISGDSGDCCSSGETILYDKILQKEDLVAGQQQLQQEYVALYKTQPIRGRILLFPHRVPHSGQPILHETSLPKICLRAEVCLFNE